MSKKHIIEEDSRQHVTYWDTEGAHCSEPDCEMNKGSMTDSLHEQRLARIGMSWDELFEHSGKLEQQVEGLEHGPKRIVMCGSSRFVDTMAVIAWLLEKHEGAITMGLHLLPAWSTTAEHHLAEHEGVAEQMDELHLRKIDLASEIFVVNLNEYVGESTAREIQYAKNRGIGIRYLSEEPRWAVLALAEEEV